MVTMIQDFEQMVTDLRGRQSTLMIRMRRMNADYSEGGV